MTSLRVAMRSAGVGLLMLAGATFCGHDYLHVVIDLAFGCCLCFAKIIVRADP